MKWAKAKRAANRLRPVVRCDGWCILYPDGRIELDYFFASASVARRVFRESRRELGCSLHLGTVSIHAPNNRVSGPQPAQETL